MQKDDEINGLKSYANTIDEDALIYFSTQSQGDVRSALNALELAVLKLETSEHGRHITLQDAKIVFKRGIFK